MRELVARSGSFDYTPGSETFSYAFNGRIPGPVIVGKDGERVTVRVRNELSEPMSVHWHGLEVENRYDGVPDVTQEAIASGESMDYELDLRAGVYWYHSHEDSARQVELGLQGPLIVTDQIESGSDTILMLDDVRLLRSGGHDRFGIGAMHGRFGNVIAVNGEQQPTYEVSDSLARLRIINSANARTWRLSLSEGTMLVIGHGIGTHEPKEVQELVLAPGERADVLVANLTASADLRDRQRSGYVPIATLTPDDRGSFSVPELQDPERPDAYEVDETIELRGAMGHGGLRWMIDEQTYPDSPATYDWSEDRVIRIVNTQGQPHPMHLHGQRFLILNSSLGPQPGWRDTVNVGSFETVDLLVRSENPGAWVFHCHILEHAEAGMLAVVNVA